MGLFKFRKKKISDYRASAVLIYTSDCRFLHYYRSMFISLGLTPVSASTLEAARGIFRLAELALVLVDQDGSLLECHEVVRRAHMAQHKVPVVIVTRRPDPNFRLEARAMEAMDYLTHPVPADEILDVLVPGHRGVRGLAQAAS